MTAFQPYMYMPGKKSARAEDLKMTGMLWFDSSKKYKKDMENLSRQMTKKRIIKIMKKKILLILWLSISICTSCGRSNQVDKLYYSIDSDNLQGLREVLADYPEIDFSKMNHHEFTAFRDYDRRALSFALDGCADETFILELLSSGKVNANNPEDSMTYLSYALCNGFSLKIAESLIENGADVNAGKETCLEGILEIVYLDMPDKDERIDFCVEHGAVVDERLLAAVVKNKYKYLYLKDVIELLRREKADIPEKYRGLIAAATGDEETLLKIALEEPDKIGKTELISAAGTCSVDTLRQLTEVGCDFDIADENEWTPLHTAAMQNNIEAVKFFIEKGLDVNAKITFSEDRPLDAAVMGVNYETIRYLLNQRAETEEMWEIACLEETGELVEFLVKEGYEPTGMDIYDALVDGSDRVFEKVIEMGVFINGMNEEIPVNWVHTEERMLTLLQKGAVITEDTLSHAVNLRAYDTIDIILRRGGGIGQESALSDAISIGDLTAVEKLVDNGADINRLVEVSSMEGRYTAMHVAAWNTSRDIIKFLVEHGGDCTIKDSSGKTPYKLAKESGLKENMRLLK